MYNKIYNLYRVHPFSSFRNTLTGVLLQTFAKGLCGFCWINGICSCSWLNYDGIAKWPKFILFIALSAKTNSDLYSRQTDVFFRQFIWILIRTDSYSTKCDPIYLVVRQNTAALLDNFFILSFYTIKNRWNETPKAHFFSSSKQQFNIDIYWLVAIVVVVLNKQKPAPV